MKQNTSDKLEPSRLQQAVEAVAISPEDAAKLVDGYRRTFRMKFNREPESLEDKRRLAKRIIGRYATVAAGVGAATAVPGVIPGIGTVVSLLGGGAADAAITIKMQVDMCLCLVELFEAELSGEDKKHLAFVLALGGSLEQLASQGGKQAVQRIAQKLVYQYLKGPLLVTIKQLFKKLSITFTQKAAAKVLPAGIGVAFSGSTNYVLTIVVGNVAVAVLAKDVK
ncbi:hypothetical protein SAMN04488242_2027 [Tessaracoccus oleiagri]|uniref:EcsC protein family protein n=2 Tax=Tessaracoccus oleiagri TaxID=686624 RepID=A0A1G9L5E8_9ACTN|nr:hypothetical protein SAMN04488242_2027 [Tessaracoccus oleiagri]